MGSKGQLVHRAGPIGPLSGFVQVTKFKTRWWWPAELVLQVGTADREEQVGVPEIALARTMAALAESEFQAGRFPDLEELRVQTTAW
jgi:hypothetical protein